MRLSAVAVLVALTTGACTAYLGERPAAYKASGSQGPRDRYEARILKSELGRSTTYAEWAAEARGALRAELSIRPSFREIVRFTSEDAVAVGYRLDLKRGQRIRIRVEDRSLDAPLFVELFEEIGTDEPIFRLIESARARSLELTFEARVDGAHVLRLQPELLRGGEAAITLTAAAALTFPVLGGNSRAIGSYFGDSRDGGRRQHEGIDIFAARGSPVLAVADGVVTDVSTTRIGGRVVWQYDSERRVHYYYAHLNSQSVRRGERVAAGAAVGTVGNTGNARTTPPHLHFGVYGPGRVALNPVPFIFDSPGDPVSPVLVDLTRLGVWTQISRAASLHAAPAAHTRVLAQLPPRTRVQIMSGVRDWHRVKLEDGRVGFIAGQANILGKP